MTTVKTVRNRFYFDYTWLLLLGLLSHCILLISDGLIWDGWWISSFQIHDQWEYLERCAIESGHRWALYLHWPFLHISNVILAYKVCGFILAVSVGPLCYHLCMQSGFLARPEAFFLALLAMIYPGFRLAGDPSMLSYQSYYFLFLVGAIFAFESRRQRGWISRAFRLLAVASFFVSFMLQSLLMFYFGFLLLFLLEEQCRQGGVSWRNLTQSLASKIDYLLLPLGFYVYKTIFDPTTDNFKEYYRLQVSVFSLLEGYKNLLLGPILGVFGESFRLLLSNWALLLIAVVVFVVTYHALRHKDKNTDERSIAPVYLLGFGLFWLCMMGLPYILVGQSNFAVYGWPTKNSLLFGIPLAIVCLASGKIVLEYMLSRSAACVPAFGAVVVFAFTVANISNYVSWQAVSVRDRSAITNFSRLTEANDSSVFHIKNEFVLPRTEWRYPSIVWSYIFKRSFSDIEVVRIFLPQPPHNGQFYTKEEINQDVFNVFLPYVLTELDRSGKQAELTIRRGPNRDGPLRLALRYWYLKYFRPGELPAFLSEVTHLTLRPMASGPSGESKQR